MSPSPQLFWPSILFALLVTTCASAQQSGSPPVYPGPSVRERNRQMDEYDRELERLRKGSTVSNKRRLNLFPQINEDFQRIQVIHNELVRMLKTEKSLTYSRVIELAGDMKKRSARLRTNLALPEPEDEVEVVAGTTTVDEKHVRDSLIQLHDVIVSFVGNPIFKNLALLDAKAVERASGDLRQIVRLSDNVKKSAETLSKTAKK